MRKKGTFGGVVLYTIIALVLGIITFVEFAIVQWPTFSSNITFSGLYILSIAKFLLVIMFFMHLKSDHKMLSGLFTTGMIIGGATVALLLFLFAAHNLEELRRGSTQEEISAHGDDHSDEATLEIPEADFEQSISRPAPKTQESLAIVGASVTGDTPSASLPDFDNLESSGELSLGHSASTELLNTQIAELEAELEEAEGAGDEERVAEIKAELEDLEGQLEQIAESESTEETEEAVEEAEEASAEFEWQELGQTTYNVCQACHQANGEGLPGAFPPLKEHITKLYNAEGGRKYIINVVLYGLQGKIEVGDTSYSSAMTSQNFLSDEQIAAVLNHELTSWGNDELLEDFNPILPEEVTAERENTLSPQKVLELRPDLP